MRTKEMADHQVYQQLRKMGVAKAVVHFSGGNDEGGADAVEFYDAEDKPVKVEGHRASRNSVYENGKWRETPYVVYTGEYVPEERPNGITGKPVVWQKPVTREATPEDIEFTRFMDALEHPVYDRYGSFAGDFEVSGSVVWDTNERTVKVSGHESVWQEF